MKNLKEMKRFVLLTLMTFLYFGMGRAATVEVDEESLEFAEIAAMQIDKAVSCTFADNREPSGFPFHFTGGKASEQVSYTFG